MNAAHENTDIQNSIDKKVEDAFEAFAAEHHGGNAGLIDEKKSLEIIKSIQFTEAERRHLGMQGLEIIVQVSIGQKVIETLKNNSCNVHRDDLIPCIQAYFDAVDAGEVEAA